VQSVTGPLDGAAAAAAAGSKKTSLFAPMVEACTQWAGERHAGDTDDPNLRESQRTIADIERSRERYNSEAAAKKEEEKNERRELKSSRKVAAAGGEK
jgi:hypothetical protein